MKELHVLIAVDAVGAAAARSLAGNVYLVDTDRYLGSWSEGKDDLHTVCTNGQVLAWSATSVSPGNEVRIQGFSGTMVSDGVCVPRRRKAEGLPEVWEGSIEARGTFAQYAYTVSLSVGGSVMSLSPYIKIV